MGSVGSVLFSHIPKSAIAHKPHQSRQPSELSSQSSQPAYTGEGEALHFAFLPARAVSTLNTGPSPVSKADPVVL